MDIDKMISDEMVRERALYERVKDWEREMEPLKLRMEAARTQWSQSYNQIKVLVQLKAFLAARETVENATDDDAAVLDADRRELAEGEPAKADAVPACLPWGNRGTKASA